MQSSRGGVFRRWVVEEMGSFSICEVYEIGSTGDGIFRDGNSRDVEFSRLEIHEIGS